jgi:hypothetical protein
LRHHIITSVIVISSILLAIFLFAVLLVYSYKPSSSEIYSIPRTAFRYTPPETLSIIGFDEDGIRVNVTLRCGIDYDRVLGIAALEGDERVQAEQRGERGLGVGWWEGLRRWIGHKALGRLPSRTVEAEIPGFIHIYPPSSSKADSTSPMVSLKLLEPLQIPLIPNLPRSVSFTEYLEPVSFEVIAKPISTTGELWDFAQQVWVDGEVKATIGIRKALGRMPGWNWMGDVRVENMMLDVVMPSELTLDLMTPPLTSLF